MDPVRWERHPALRRPLLVVAFEGWNDAGDASSLALSYLAQAWDARRFATIDGEDFYDFTVTRPLVSLSADGQRTIEWPDVELLGARVAGSAHDLILVRGVEPQMKWRAFCTALVGAARVVGAEMAVILGSLLADVPHTRPVHVTGTTDDQHLAQLLGLTVSSYEGPTGIIGVLHEALRKGGIPSASFWAAVPHYVHQLPSPKAALALVEKSATLLGAPVDPNEMRMAVIEYERQVAERVEEDEDTAAYVAQLEEAEDSDGSGWQDPPPAGLPAGDIDELADEVERFLRDHPREG